MNSKIINLIMLLASFFALLNEVSTNMAFPDFMRLFDVSVATVQWLTTGFMLVMTVIMPATAFINRRFTTRQIFFAAMSLLVAGTLLSGLAETFPVMLIGRLLQAAGTCVTISLLINTVLLLTPVSRRGTAMGLVSLVLLLAPALAPTLAGMVIHYGHWRWLFLGLTPLFLALSAVAAVILKNVNETGRAKIDWLSLLLSSLTFVCLLYGIGCAGEAAADWRKVSSLLVAGFLTLGLFIQRQITIEDPLLDLRVFRYPMFSLGIVLIVFSMMLLFGILFFVPMFLQGIYGLTSSAAGLAMLPAGILSGVLAPLVGRLFDKIGPKPLIIPGIVVLIAAAWQLSAVSAATGIAAFVGMHCCFAVGIALILAPAQTHGTNQLPKPLYPHGTAIIATVMQFGGGLGTAAFVNIVSLSQRHFLEGVGRITADVQQIAMVHGFHRAFQAEIPLLILCMVLALRIKHTGE